MKDNNTDTLTLPDPIERIRKVPPAKRLSTASTGTKSPSRFVRDGGNDSIESAVRRVDRPELGQAVAVEEDSFLDSERLEAAIAALAESSVAELRFLRVDESEHELRLSGNVSSFYHKQLAQEILRPIAEGKQVVNRVDVEG
ncbi:MAG: BON domain-containing protein [Planctomycetota bacterium]